MIDVFSLFHVETKEDIYTFCLLEMLKNGDLTFKQCVGAQFGFDDGEYQVIRRAFQTGNKSENNNDKSVRTQIIPDMVLCNGKHIAIVESKMFSSEGYKQTDDYEENALAIKKQLHEDKLCDNDATVSFYFLTLSGVTSESKSFQPIKWSSFYSSVLSKTEFKDECLEVIRKTILNQVKKYNEFERAISIQAYKDLFNKASYWITPMTLLASGTYDSIWKALSDDEQFSVLNREISGHGHSEFTTDLNKPSWRKRGIGRHDSIHLFIRIEWNEGGPIVWLCWEYNDQEDNYLATKEIDIDFRGCAIESLIKYKNIWNAVGKKDFPQMYSTSRKASSIKALKCQVDKNLTIDETVKQVAEIVIYYSREIQRILNAFHVIDKYLSFDEKSYMNSCQLQTGELF